MPDQRPSNAFGGAERYHPPAPAASPAQGDGFGVPLPQKARYCTACGWPLPPDGGYCERCGAKVDEPGAKRPERYASRARTPLNYHHFLHFAGMPVNALLCIILFQPDGTIEYYPTPAYRMLFVIVFALSVVCFVGFFRWKPYAWYAVMINIGVIPLFYLLSSFADAVLGADAVIDGMLLFVSAIISWPLLVYYHKRKALFFQPGAAVPQPTGRTSAAARRGNAEPSRSCPNCSEPYRSPDAAFCHKCGKKLENTDVSGDKPGIGF